LVAGSYLSALAQVQQVQQGQQVQQVQQVQPHPGASIPQPAAPPAAAARPPRPELTPEQQRKLDLIRATPAQDARQQSLAFVYLDLDEGGEDIIHFSELFAPSDSAVRVSRVLGRMKTSPCKCMDERSNQNSAMSAASIVTLQNCGKPLE
jgi:hypothetical protein